MNIAEVYYQRSQESLEDIPTPEFMSLIEPKIEQAISLEGLKERLKDGDKLNVKFGTDPTGPELHLGHIVPIRMLDIFSRAGHNVDLIFGDFTAKVGDPTERSEGRKVLSDDEIASNMSTYQEQVDKYFDTRKENVRVHQNSLWLGNMALSEAFGYLQSINLTEATQRKDFRDRMAHGKSVSLAETIYGTLMGIDSVKLGTDVEIGGVDQLLNFQQTRAVQRAKGQTAEEILMTPIIQGTSGDGRKMSKSYGNYIAATATPLEVFGKLMSIPDNLIVPYFAAFAPVYGHEVTQLEQQVATTPLEMKKQLATYMAGLSGGALATGLEARTNFERRFARKEVTHDDAREITGGESLLTALMSSGDFKSKGELRTLVRQGGIKVTGNKIDEDALLAPCALGSIVTVGKRRVYRLANLTDEAK